MPVSEQPAQASPEGSRVGRRRSAGPAAVAGDPALAVGVDETVCDAFVLRASTPYDDRVFADRHAGGREPLFPLLWALWFTIGVQQQPPTVRAAIVLDSQEP